MLDGGPLGALAGRRVKISKGGRGEGGGSVGGDQVSARISSGSRGFEGRKTRGMRGNVSSPSPPSPPPKKA